MPDNVYEYEQEICDDNSSGDHNDSTHGNSVEDGIINRYWTLIRMFP